MSERPDDDDDAAANRRTGALAGIAVILLLAILGVILVRELGKRSELEDCLMSGRTNCAPIQLPRPQ